MKYLLLGGMGYAGARVAVHLAKQAEVTVTSRHLSPIRQKWLQEHPEVRWIEYDSGKGSELPRGKFDAIVNFAMPSASEAAANPDESEGAALLVVSEMIRKLENEDCGRVIHLSSFHAYGPQPVATFYEDLPLNPRAPYAKIHSTCEGFLKTQGAHLPIYIVRPTNSVGCPAIAELGVQQSLIFHDCCRQAIRNRRIELRNDGKSFRDFFPLSDLARAIELLCGEGSSEFDVFNLASGRAVPLEEFVQLVATRAKLLLGEKIPVMLGSEVDAFRTPFTVDCSRIKKRGWEPLGSLAEEISGILEFFEFDHITD